MEIDLHIAQNDGSVHGSGAHGKTGRHCLAADPKGKLDITKASGFWMRDEMDQPTKAPGLQPSGQQEDQRGQFPSFACSDPFLTDLWRVYRDALRLCVQDIHLDTRSMSYQKSKIENQKPNPSPTAPSMRAALSW